MGLVSYLYVKETFFSSFGSSEEEIKNVKSIARKFGSMKFYDPDALQEAQIKLQIAYWIKANHIHQYFLNLITKEDDCSPIYLTKDDLENLLILCLEVYHNPKKAHELLPTKSGFFFGSLDYDSYYFDQVNYTIEMLRKILKRHKEGWTYEYKASW